MKTILIQHGRAHEIFGAPLSDIRDRFAADLVKQMIEHDGPVAVGQLWDGTEFYTPAPPLPTAGDVRAEAQRRLIRLLAARDAHHLDLIIANGTREAVRLQQRQLDGQSLNAAEQARALVLKQTDQAIEAVRAASNRLETDPPADFADDRHWPPQPT